MEQCSDTPHKRSQGWKGFIMEQHDLTSQPATPIKKSCLLGIIAFLLLLAAGALLAYVGLSAVRAYLGGNLGSLNVGRILTSVKITVILSGASCLLALITLFLKGQKKGLAIFTLIFALLMFLVIGAMQYAYHSVNSSINRDESFTELPDEELLVTPQQPGGKIDFELDIPVETISKEEIEDIKIKNELDWPLLEETDVPNNAYPYMYGQSPSSPCVLLPGAEQIENYILFGIDDNMLSDVIMVLSMDRAHKKIKLISIQRDTYVLVPNWGGYTKINHAYGVGKEKSSIQTLNLNFKLNIRDYFTVHYGDVSALVDIVGGVDVYVDQAELSYMQRSYGYTDLVVGINHLTGAQALNYSRIRKSGANDNEFVRTSRQREVLNSMYQSVKASSPTYYPELVNTFAKLCGTSVETEKILSMMLEAVADGYTLENHALINMVDFWDGQFGPGNLYYLVYDLDAAGDMIYRTIYEDLYISGYPGNEKFVK